MAIATLTIDLVAKVADLQRDFNRAQQVAENAAKRMQSAFALVGNVVGGLGVSLGAGALVSGIANLVSAIDDLDERAQGLGVTATALANLQIGAREAGVGAEQLDAALTKLNVRLGDAASGNREAAQLFKALGVEIRDSAGNLRGTDQVLRDVADRFRGLEDGAAKSALAVELFGKSGAKLIAFLNQGGDGLERNSKLTQQYVIEAGRLQTRIDELGASFDRLKFSVGGELAANINAALDVFNRVDFSKFATLTQGGPGALLGLGRAAAEVARATQEVADRQKQLNDALALGAGAYSNEGRSATRSAQAILENARAKDENAKASKRAAQATMGGVFDAEFRDANRIRENRRRLDEQVDEDNQAAARRRQDRLDDLLGRSQLRELESDLQQLDEAFFNGLVGVNEYDAALERLLGKDLPDKLDKASDSAEQFALVFASSLGQFIEQGGGAINFLEALGRDLLKLTTQLLIVEPLAKALKEAFKGISGGGGFGDLLGSLGAGLFGGGKAIGGPVMAGTTYLVGERGPELFTPRQSGQIIPNGAMRQSTTVNVTVPGGVGRETASQLASAVSRRLAFARFR